jgi:hypothetical protein
MGIIKEIEPYLALKRNEIVWSLIKQGYTPAQVSRMFSMPTSTSHKIASQMPPELASPWTERYKVSNKKIDNPPVHNPK